MHASITKLDNKESTMRKSFSMTILYYYIRRAHLVRRLYKQTL